MASYNHQRCVAWLTAEGRTDFDVALLDAPFTDEQRAFVERVLARQGELMIESLAALAKPLRALVEEGVLRCVELDRTRAILGPQRDFEQWGRFAVARARVAAIRANPVWWHPFTATGAHKGRRRRGLGAAARLRVFRRDRFRCVECGEGDDLTVDHIVPVSRGGTNDPENLQTLCARCNRAKGSRLEAPRG